MGEVRRTKSLDTERDKIDLNFFSPSTTTPVVATTRRLPSDSGAFADWVAAGRADDLSLGFSAPPGPIWPPNLRDVFVVAAAPSYHHHAYDPAAVAPSDHHHNPAAASTALGVGVGLGVIPVLADGEDRSRAAGGIHLWQQNHHHHHYQKPVNLGGSGGIGVTNSTNSSAGTATCQDCGNQAKKDCTHGRCRTCCKSRGYDCSTHVRSTWVPAARRRERQLMGSGSVAGAPGSSGATSSGTKKPRLVNNSQTTTTSHTSTSNNTPPRSHDTSSSHHHHHHQDGSFRDGLPGQVHAPAVFKCVRVTAMDDGEDQFAYQAVVKIHGRVFKGFLYDQGAEPRDVFPNISELHLGGGSGGGGGSSPGPILNPSDVYAAAGGGGFLGGSGYGNTMN